MSNERKHKGERMEYLQARPNPELPTLEVGMPWEGRRVVK